MSTTPEPKPDEQDEQGFSLRSLSEAFAEALSRTGEAGSSEDSTSREAPVPGEVSPGAMPAVGQGLPIEASGEAIVDEPPPEAEEHDEDDMCPISPRTILEAMLFVGDPANRPLESAQAAELMRGVDPEDIPVLIEELNASYCVEGCPYRIRSAGSGFRLVLDEQHHRVRDKFYGRIREARLSQAAIDVLAIVAYRQPIRADEVSRLRDKPCQPILAQLVRRRLLCVERSSGKPREAFYRTTDRFLSLFELESLDDLPESEELNRS